MRKHLRRKSNSEFSVVFFLVEGRKEWIGLFWFLFCLNITSFSVLLSFSSLTNGMGLREIKYARALLLFSLHFSFGFFFKWLNRLATPRLWFTHFYARTEDIGIKHAAFCFAACFVFARAFSFLPLQNSVQFVFYHKCFWIEIIIVFFGSV